MPKVSVIMGMYNSRSKEILKKSIDSILNQTFSDFEYIICNDGSTNDCLIWAKDICKNDDRVIFIENEKNMGLSYTLNQCLRIAKGDFIARMDDDDESDVTRFEKQVDLLEHNPKFDLVGSNMILFDDSRGDWGNKIFPEVIKKEDFLFNSPVGHPTIMARKKVYDLVGGYRDLPETLRVEDYDCFMRMFARGVNMYNYQEPLLNYREDSNSAKRRKYKYRFTEMWVRYHGFKELNLLNIKNYAYVIKPLIVGLIPQKWLKSKYKK